MRSPAIGGASTFARAPPGSREEEILRLVAEWQTNAEIGRRLPLSELTVKNHVSSILGKLEVSRRTEAAA